jgi:predicted RNase H-like HicB family nuclease
MSKFLVIFEETATGYSAFSPDLPGCVATGATRDEVEARMKEVIEFHLEGMKQEGYSVPEPTTRSAYLEVTV